MSDTTQSIATDVVQCLAEYASKKFGCQLPAGTCLQCQGVAREIANALAARFTFHLIQGENTIAPAAIGKQDPRFEWAPALKRIERRLRGEIVVQPLDADFQALTAIRNNLEAIFGAAK